MTEKGEKRKNIVAVCLLILGVALIVFGVFEGQAKSVLFKAARVCMECVGIG